MRVAPVHLRPGRPVDLPALLELWRREMREGRLDSVPREAELQGLLPQRGRAHARQGTGLCLMAVGARSGTPAAITLCQVETFQNETHAFDVYPKLGFAWAFAAEVWEATYE